MAQHYYEGQKGEAYFKAYQEQFLADSAGAYVASKFNPVLNESWVLLDFGCSAGEATAKLVCKNKSGLEINSYAAEIARKKHNLIVVQDLSELPPESFDVVVSHHVLEHVENPFHVLKGMHKVLKSGGRIMIIVPGETGWYNRSSTWREEINKHIYSWTPLTLGNLAQAAGFEVNSAVSLDIVAPSRYLSAVKYFGPAKRFMGVVRRLLQGETEVMLIASKT